LIATPTLARDSGSAKKSLADIVNEVLAALKGTAALESSLIFTSKEKS
jgi:hypothetical protein